MKKSNIDQPMIKKICLLGAGFDTGNLGVSALADASMKILWEKWPKTEIVLVGSGYEVKTEDLPFLADKNKIFNIPIRFSRNIFHECHFLRFFFYGTLLKLGLKNAGNQYFKKLNSCNLVCDITGGDSFSDIYGFKRFLLGFLQKWLFLFLGKDLVMLPQTYGPFKKKITKKMAAYILRKAKSVYSRDKNGVELASQLLNASDTDKVRLCPDVAFALDIQPWDAKAIEQIDQARARGHQVIGLNISGLLYNGGYSRNNMFNLSSDYPQLIKQIIDYFLEKDNVTIVLVPHVFPPEYMVVEDDAIASKTVYDSLTEAKKNRIILPEKQPDQRQIKYLIGKCDFFIGSRMHACIAALSQSIPAIGIAYSDKFQGVFETINFENCVSDMRTLNNVQMLETIKSAFSKSSQLNKRLDQNIPIAKSNISNLFNEIENKKTK